MVRDIKEARIVGTGQVKGGGERVLVHVAVLASRHKHLGAVCRERDVVGGAVLGRDVKGARRIGDIGQVKGGVKLVLVHAVVLASRHKHLGAVCRERDAGGKSVLSCNIKGARRIVDIGQVKGGVKLVLVHAVLIVSRHKHLGAVCRERGAVGASVLRLGIKGACRIADIGQVKGGVELVLVHAVGSQHKHLGAVCRE